MAGSGTQEASTTMAFAKLLRNLLRDKGIGERIVPIIPDEARTFGMDPLFKEVGIYSALGQRYDPVDSNLVLSYREATDGQVLEEGITEAGSSASFQAAGTSYATHARADDPVLHLLFDVRLPAHRRRVLGVRRRARPGLPARRHGRPHDAQRRGAAARGRPTRWSPRVVSHRRVYDPAFAYETAVARARRHRAHVRRRARGRSLLPRAVQRELRDAGAARRAHRRGHRARPLPLPAAPDAAPRARRGRPSWARARSCSRRCARRSSWPSGSASPPTSGARRRTSCCATRRSRPTAGTCSIPASRRACRWSRQLLAEPASPRPHRRGQRLDRGLARPDRRAGCRATRGAAWAPTASGGATRARPCAASSRSTRTTSRWRSCPSSRAAARSGGASHVRGHGAGRRSGGALRTEALATAGRLAAVLTLACADWPRLGGAFHAFIAALPVAMLAAGRQDAEIGAVVGSASVFNLLAALASAGSSIDTVAVGVFLLGCALLFAGAAPWRPAERRPEQSLCARSWSACSRARDLLRPAVHVQPGAGHGLEDATAHRHRLRGRRRERLAGPRAPSRRSSSSTVSGSTQSAWQPASRSPWARLLLFPLKGAERTARAVTPGSSPRTFRPAWRPSWAAPLAIAFLFVAHWGVVTAYLPQRAELAGADIGLFFTGDALALLAFRVPAGWLAGRIGPLPLILAGVAVTALSLALLLLPPPRPCSSFRASAPVPAARSHCRS